MFQSDVVCPGHGVGLKRALKALGLPPSLISRPAPGRRGADIHLEQDDDQQPANLFDLCQTIFKFAKMKLKKIDLNAMMEVSAKIIMYSFHKFLLYSHCTKM